jgi:hypothetical protein
MKEQLMTQFDKIQYSDGLLNPRPYKPLPHEPPSTLLTDEPSADAVAEYFKELVDYSTEELKEQEEVRNRLMDEFSIERNQKDRWKALAWALAQNHVRAMERQSGPTGRPKTWAGPQRAVLLAEVYNEYIETLTNQGSSSGRWQVDELMFLERVKKAHPEKYRTVSLEAFQRGFRTARKAPPAMVEMWNRVLEDLASRGK